MLTARGGNFERSFGDKGSGPHVLVNSAIISSAVSPKRIVQPIRAAIGLFLIYVMLAHTGGVAASVSTSDPTCAYQFNLLGNSDTVISLPVARSKAASGLVASFSGNLITANGSPGWATGQFIPQAFNPTRILFTFGAV
jgi:hypothetical protein